MSSGALISQQLSEFLAVLSTCADAPAATRASVDRAAQAVGADVGAVLGPLGVVAAVGFDPDHVPADELALVAAGSRSTLRGPDGVERPALAAPVGDTEPSYLVLARPGNGEFTADETSLIRGMARMLALTLRTLRDLEAERRRAAENAGALATLRERHRLMEQLSLIQRAIARRAPLQQILDTITDGAGELLGDEAVGLRLLDADDPDVLILVSSQGLPPDIARQSWRLPMSNAGVAGEAIRQNTVVIIDGYDRSPLRVTEMVNAGIQTAMAAPVHDKGVVVGCLVVASYDPDRRFGKADQETLLAFAEHVSLAVTDSRTVEAMHRAFHDQLTGLASRDLFIDRLEHGLAVADREQSRVAVLFVDLDRFKTVNESLGHAAGDGLLISVGERLRAGLRGADTAARFGGDEFAVLLHEVNRAEQASAVAERIIKSLREPFLINGKEVYVDASVGIGFSGLGERDSEVLMQNAELAMHEAKRKGKGRYEVFDPGMHESLRKSLDMEADLRRAVVRKEFVLRYQPIVELSTRRITGLEALVRWIHPERGMVPPLDFIPLAEETGLILPIGHWVLQEACRQVSVWNASRSGQPPLTISVNLSARQLQQPELPTVVADVLREAGLEAGCLVLEITESLLVHDTDATAARMRALKDLGVRLAVDDFGTGYSSLAYLQRFPVDILKIDKSFIDDLGREGKASALAPAIVRLGQTLELSTVAEGIELAEQYGQLFASGCELGQGYYFAKPLTADEVEALLGMGAASLPVPPPADSA